jgi:hypothetical protein
MPEDNLTMGVKDVAVESPSTASPMMTVEPPAAEHAVQPESGNTGHVPYLRFKEVNDKMRSYEAELAKLRSTNELAKPQAVTSEKANDELNDSQEDEEMSKYERRVVESGVDPKIAKGLARVMKDIAKEEAKDRSRKESERSAERQVEEGERLVKAQKEIAQWQSDFRKAHADYADVEPKMQKRWDKLSDAAKKALVASPESYELLYESAKSDTLESVKDEGREEGKLEAYGTKGLKSALSSVPGSTANPGKKFTAEDVAGMSNKEYSENREKIFKDLGLKK